MIIYQPAEDSFLLEKEVKKYSKGKKFLDLGAGSGIQGKAALKSGAKNVFFSDVNKIALEKLKAEELVVINSDLFSNIEGKFDIISFNPPYLPEDKREDKESAIATTGGKRGDEIILKFLKGAKSHLNKEGIILLVVSSLTPKEKIIKLLEKQKMKREVLSTQKLFFETLEVWKISNN